MGVFAELVADLSDAAALARGAFEAARHAGSQVRAEDLLELAGALAGLDRAAQAASHATLAQFARREQVQDPHDPEELVEKVHPLGFVEDFASTEVAMALGISARTAGSRVGQGVELATRLPQVLGKVAQGLVEPGQACRVLARLDDAGIATPEQCHAVDDYLARRLGTVDPTRLGALTGYAIGRLYPEAQPMQAAANVEDRSFTVLPGPAGLAEISALVPAAQAAALWSAADALAQEYRRDDPALTTSQARADAFVDLALGNVEVTARVDLGIPVVTSTVSALGAGVIGTADDQAPGLRASDVFTAGDAEEWLRTLDVEGDPWYSRHLPEPARDAGLEQEAAGPAEPSGHVQPSGLVEPSAPVALPTAVLRCGAAAGARTPAGWSICGAHLPRVGYVPPDVVTGLLQSAGTQIGLALLDADTGVLLATTTTAYRPSAAMRHFITVRDQRCRMFGCQLRAQHWDLDHAIAHPRGATTPSNLAGLCRRHHRVKQHRRWRYHLREDGVATWQSPTGAVRVTYPDAFLVDPDPPEPAPAAATPRPPDEDGEPPF